MKRRKFQRTAAPQDARPKGVVGTSVYGGFVPLAREAQTEDGWAVLAYAVEMKASKVSLTRKDFEDCVRNFNAYPCCPVTIEHADVADDPFGALPKEWKEPSGHIEKLRVGEMQRTVGDKTVTVATLEGVPSYLGAAAQDVAGGKWRFGSITIIHNATDEETGAKLGAMLWSWSLTAHPRLTSIPRLAASVAASMAVPGAAVSMGYWWGDIDDRDDLLAMLRCVFDLPVTKTEEEVLAELDKLESLTKADDTGGVDVDRIVGQIRDALRLPALTSTADVLAEVRKGLNTLPASSDDGADTSLSRDPAPTTETRPMLKYLELAARFGLAATSEDDAREKVLAFLSLGHTALKTLGLAPTATAQELSARVDALTVAAARVPALEADLATLRKEREKADEAVVEQYFAELLAVQPELKASEESLRLHAKHDRGGFEKKYPRPKPEELLQAAQHPERLSRVVPPAGPTDTPGGGGGAAPTAAPVVVSMVHTHIAFARSQGRELSFSAALAELTATAG